MKTWHSCTISNNIKYKTDCHFITGSWNPWQTCCILSIISCRSSTAELINSNRRNEIKCILWLVSVDSSRVDLVRNCRIPLCNVDTSCCVAQDKIMILKSHQIKSTYQSINHQWTNKEDQRNIFNSSWILYNSFDKNTCCESGKDRLSS